MGESLSGAGSATSSLMSIEEDTDESLSGSMAELLAGRPEDIIALP